MASVCIAIPAYNQMINQNTVKSVLMASPKGQTFAVNVSSTSAWSAQLNGLMFMAMERRAQGATHLLYLHIDVAPAEAGWLDLLIAQMEETKADVVASVIMANPESLLTSTFIETADPWRPKQLSLLDIPPGTGLVSDKLLINSGCMLIDLHAKWVGKVFFKMEEIIKDGIDLYEREDWAFSRQVRAHGGTICATNKIKIEHWMPMAARNW